jgi:hypothetical protein
LEQAQARAEQERLLREQEHQRAEQERLLREQEHILEVLSCYKKNNP